MSGFRELQGMVAVVTGGAAGIGRALGRHFGSLGMHVVLADIDEEALQATADELDAVGIPTDVSDLGSVQELASTVARRFGTAHVVCNNAGVGPVAQISELTLDDWNWMLGVNLYGVIHGITTFLPMLEANQNGGHLVNTASIAGLVPQPRQGAYSVSKFGVVALTETLAAELDQSGSSVGATVLCPGPVRTDIHSSSRHRPSRFESGALRDFDTARLREADLQWADPSDVGPVVVTAMARGDLYAVTHPEWEKIVQHRHAAISAAFTDRQRPSVGKQLHP